MKKIVHLIHGLNTGGAETLVKNYCLGLDKSKYTREKFSRIGSLKYLSENTA